MNSSDFISEKGLLINEDSVCTIPWNNLKCDFDFVNGRFFIDAVELPKFPGTFINNGIEIWFPSSRPIYTFKTKKTK